MKLFVSHSVRDVRLAATLVTLLRTATSLQPTDIRCSSVDGYRLPAGANTSDLLRREVHDSEVFVGLITPASVASSYVLFELGARWGARRAIMPLLARGATPSLLPGPLIENNALSITSPAQLHQFLDEVAAHLQIRLVSPAAYQSELSAVVASAIEPDTTPVVSAIDLPIRPKPQRLRAAFLAGSGLGQRIILVPMSSRDVETLKEFVKACRTLGLDGNSIDYLEAYIRTAIDLEAEEDHKTGREQIQKILEALGRVEDDLPPALSGMELGWYKLGYQLHQVSALALAYAHASEKDDADSIAGPLLALKATIELLDGPPSIIKALNEVLVRAERGEEATSLYRGFQDVALAIHSLLDVLVRPPDAAATL